MFKKKVLLKKRYTIELRLTNLHNDNEGSDVYTLTLSIFTLLYFSIKEFTYGAHLAPECFFTYNITIGVGTEFYFTAFAHIFIRPIRTNVYKPINVTYYYMGTEKKTILRTYCINGDFPLLFMT